MPAREVSEREDHEAESEAETGGDAGRPDAALLGDRGCDAAEPEEEEAERADGLGQQS